jgi:arabinofuranosyltransferase
VRDPVKSAHAALRLGFVLVAVQLLRTAWLCDDAYITFRTADNILNGHGAVWNLGERVQTYTHPLWLGVCTLFFSLTGEFYYSAIALSLLITGLSLLVLAARLGSSPLHVVLCLSALISSKAWIDYSTSGLENPLTHLLIFIFVWQWWDTPGSPSRSSTHSGTKTASQSRLQRLAAIAALLVLNRTDLILIVAPPLLYESVRLGVRPAARPLIVGFAPVLVWETFSFFYYGSLVPNTAYAKLSDGMPSAVRYGHGYDYFWRTATADPATLPVIALACVTIPRARWAQDSMLAIGTALYLAYVFRIGGDFMLGRFFTAPFVVGVALLARAPWVRRECLARLATAVVIAVGLVAPWEPALLSGIGYAYVRTRLVGPPSTDPLFLPYFRDRQITDERRYYYENMGLLKVGRRGGPKFEADDGPGLQRQDGRRVIVRNMIGLAGYSYGPAVHIVDEYGLADALVARLPGGNSASTIGHLERQIPAGYLETLASGENHIADRHLAAFYDRLRFVVSGPLWSGQRLRTALGLLRYRDDEDFQRYLAATATPSSPLEP